ncbi:alg12 alpha-1,6-mannosyltransferase [Arctopsyche grandis]|uniref:alg12 alpha-1,6-mannosyltransferase n=1 Tax=Arctopsyche grandis TaxID=121162 RepID=UPI00406D93B5
MSASGEGGAGVRLSQLATVVSVLHLVWCPFTKVEESHAMQATHDLLYLRTNFTQYDHHEFSGVVPRSFIGPIFLSILSTPMVFLIQICECNKFWSQYIVRLSLALSVIFSWTRLRESLSKIFGNSFSIWFTAITVTQYHFMFYLSRTLPNIIVMPLVLLAMDYWINGKHDKFVYASGAAIIIFRAELSLLLGQFLLYDIFLKRLSLVRCLKLVIPTALALILLTVSIDSFFWHRLTWPEAEVFWFNTVLNKSSQWGTSPFLWYWYSALPRGLGPSLLLIPIGAYFDRRTLAFITPALTFVLLFSFLPHKELRFIIYVFPLLNIAAASAGNYLWDRRGKTTLYQFLACCSICCLIGNSLLSLTFLSVASTNYPGGAAISRLHRLLKNESLVNVHIDNLAAQTGVTRYTQLNDDWKYGKLESLAPERLQMYTHLIIEGKNKYSSNIKQFSESHVVLDFIESFSHISINYQSLPPFKIKTRPSLFILERLLWQENPLGLDLPPLKPVVDSDDEQDDLFNNSIEDLMNDYAKDDMSDTENVVDSINEPANIRHNIKQLIEKYKGDEFGEEENVRKLNNLRENMKKIHDVHVSGVKKFEMKKKQHSDKEKSKLSAASTKQKLKELIGKHRKEVLDKENANTPEEDVQNVDIELLNDTEETIAQTFDAFDIDTNIEDESTLPSNTMQIEYDTMNYLRNTSVQDIVEEVMRKIESQTEDDSILDIKGLDSNEKRKAIQRIVEEILYEKIGSQKSSAEEMLENHQSEEMNIEIKDSPFILEEDVNSYQYESGAVENQNSSTVN